MKVMAKYKTLSVKEYHDEIKPYLKDNINNLKNLIRGKVD